MEIDQIVEICHRWIAAFNVHEAKQVVAEYDDNASHYSRRVDGSGWLRGRDQLLAHWQRSFEKNPQLSYQLVSLAAGPTYQNGQIIRSPSSDTDVLASQFPGKNTVNMTYIRHNPGETSLHVMEYFRFGERQIVESRVLADWDIDVIV